MNKNLKISGIIYSIFSGLTLPFLLLIQIMSIFLFDSPGSTQSAFPYIIALGILLIPVILIVSNIFMWISIKKTRVISMSVYMALPIIYTILFFTAWTLFEDSFV